MIAALSKVSVDTGHFLDFSISGLRRFRFTYLRFFNFFAIREKSSLMNLFFFILGLEFIVILCGIK